MHGGVHALLVLGTIGEGQYVSMPERAQVVATAVRVAGPLRVIVGIHTCDLELAQAQVHQASVLGAAAVLVKYVGNPRASADEVLGFFALLSEKESLPIFYYHYPSQTGLKLTPKDVALILRLPGVIGIKESTLDLRETQTHMQLTCDLGKTFLSGTALNLTQFLELGGHGAMCPEAAVLPGLTVQAYEAYQHGQHEKARGLQKDLFVLTPILRDHGLPALTRVLFITAQDHKVAIPMGSNQPEARLKAALSELCGPMSVEVKCPLAPLSIRDQRRVHRSMENLAGQSKATARGF